MSRAVPARPGLALTAWAAVTLLVAGCSSDGNGGATTPSAPTAPSSTPSNTATGTPTTSDVHSKSPSADPTSPAPSRGSPTPSNGLGTPTSPACSDLDVTATRVPGAAGVTYGLVSVTNRGVAPCSLPGVPSLRLLDASRRPVTAVATADDGAGIVTLLAPGAVASTLLEDSSVNCQADTRSAYVEVTPTRTAATVTLALVLPPCSLSVKPFVPGSSPAP